MSHRPRGTGQVFLDARGDGRAIRLTWHHEVDLVVLSLWRDHVCTGTFRLETSDVADFVDALVDGLRGAEGVSMSPATPMGVEPSRALPPPATLPPRQRRPDDSEPFVDWAFEATEHQPATAG
jgi:hypothetical protein